MTLYEFLNRLKAVKKLSNGQFTARCPGHEDNHNSLSVSQEQDRILVKCFVGCSADSIVEHMGLELKDLFLTEPSKPISKVISKIVKTYSYVDEAGVELFQTVRYVPKDFAQRHKNGKGEWVWDLKGVRRVLYNLPDVLATPAGMPIYMVEGEKDADNLKSNGLIATTSPCGANSWNPDYAEYLKDKSLIIIPDKDTAGYAYAKDIIKSVKDKAQDVSVIILPPPAKDVSDWLEAGGKAQELFAMAEDISTLFKPEKVEYRQLNERVVWEKRCEY